MNELPPSRQRLSMMRHPRKKDAFILLCALFLIGNMNMVEFVSESETKNIEIFNSEFYPLISLEEFDCDYALKQKLTPNQKALAIQDAVLHINSELIDWQKAHEPSVDKLVNIDKDPRTDKSGIELVFLYKRSVYLYAKQILIDEYRDISSTAHAHHRADDMENKVDDFRSRSYQALNEILGKPNLVVELI